MFRAVLLAVTLSAAVAGVPPLKKQFEQFKKQFGKKYASDAEEDKRFQIFKATVQRVNDANARNGKEPVFGITFTADLNIDEKFKRGRKAKGDTRFVETTPVYASEGLLGTTPKAIDWRLTKAVTAVKNQGQCGSCWAFSTTEEVESQYIMQVSDDYLEDFSAQQINSCVAECDGCGGGDTVTAFQYLKTAPGLAQSAFWPYAQGLTPLNECNGKSCTQSCSTKNLTELAQYEFYIGPYATVTGFKYATPACIGACANQDLTTLAASLSEAGPISICVNAGAWDDYTGGVMTASGCGGMAYDDIDHCVQLVGFNATASTPYWIVRNSWATDWGMSGYIHLEYGKNTCGLADEATIATLQTSVDNGVGSGAKRERWTRLYKQATGDAQGHAERLSV